MSLLELGEVLQAVVLPLLSIREIVMLANSCRHLRSLAYGAPASVWEAAARQYLPKPHPLAQTVSRQSIQRALQTYSDTSRREVHTSKAVWAVRLSDGCTRQCEWTKAPAAFKVSELQVAPDGHWVAVFIKHAPHEAGDDQLNPDDTDAQSKVGSSTFG
ncbi:hypothetical protein WJX73_004593 [Symbiochloris irregularis]|uniref:F-box domain-containing protein n=1 Tax=Symbiochloris irregularis TaxID=706552 RepID=A0AAW1P195_9CHLO